MATKLFLRLTQTHGLTPSGDGTWYDMLTTAGAVVGGSTVPLVVTVASGTEIQFGGDFGTIGWISGRVPSGGFTLTTTDVSVWQAESNMNANIGGRFRVFKRTSAGVITELAGGPFSDGVEMNTSAREDTWVGNVTDTAFAEDDRILVRFYITNVGTMGDGFTGTLRIDAADGATGDTFFNIAETVAFKAESAGVTVNPGVGAVLATGFAPTIQTPRTVNPGTGEVLATGFAPTVVVTAGTVVSPGTGVVTATGFAPTIETPRTVNPGLGEVTATGFAPTIQTPRTVNPGTGEVTATGFAPTVTVTANTTASTGLGELVATGLAPTVTVTTHVLVRPGLGELTATGFAPEVEVTSGTTVLAGLGEVIATGFAPTVAVTANVRVDPGLGELVATGFAPEIEALAGTTALTGTGEVLAEGFAPTIQISAHVTVETDTGTVTATGFAPEVEISGAAEAPDPYAWFPGDRIPGRGKRYEEYGEEEEPKQEEPKPQPKPKAKRQPAPLPPLPAPKPDPLTVLPVAAAPVLPPTIVTPVRPPRKKPVAKPAGPQYEGYAPTIEVTAHVVAYTQPSDPIPDYSPEQEAKEWAMLLIAAGVDPAAAMLLVGD